MPTPRVRACYILDDLEGWVRYVLPCVICTSPSYSSSGSSRRGHPDGSSRRVIQTGHPDGVIQTGSSRRGHTCQKHIKLVFCFVLSHRSHTHLHTHTLCIQVHIHLKLPLRNHAANRRRIGFILADTHRLTRTGNLLLNRFAPFSHR